LFIDCGNFRLNFFFAFSQAQDSGQGIRFAKANGAHLAYQIERWDRGNQLAEIWVRVDTVYGYNGSQYFTMYWGNPSVGSASNGNVVFDTANGFVGVWHLNEGSGNAVDASVNSLTGTTHSGVGYSKSGGIGTSDSMDGTNNGYFDMGTSANYNMNTNKRLTVSAWVNHGNATMGAWEGIAGRWNWAGGTTWREFDLFGGSGTLGFCISTDGSDGTKTTVSANTSVTNGTWNYITGALDGTNMIIYQNGASQNSAAKTDVYYASAANMIVGSMGVASSQNWNGKIDEVRLEKVARTNDWVKLCYENQKPNQTLISTNDYSKWAFSRNITVNTSGITTTNLIGFPMLVRLTSSNFDFNQAQSSGQDIRFSKADGTHLPYQIERWSQGSQVAEIWVKIDTVLSNNSTQYFKMYWGNSTASDSSNGYVVFDTANGFAGVWHLGETGNTTAGGYADATYNANNGTGTSTTSSQVTAAVGNGQTFDGSTKYVTVANATTLNPGYMTVSVWANPTAWATDLESIVSKQTSGTPWPPFDFRKTIGASTIEAAATVSGTSYTVAGGTVSTGSWQYLTFTFDGTNLTVYNNGVQSGTAVHSGTLSAGTSVMTFGQNSTVASRMFNGIIDEVQMSKIARSVDWIRMCYETQRPTGNTVVTSDSADAFRPLSIKRNAGMDTVIVWTNRWAVKFLKAKGGGIGFLGADTASASNQIASNMFYLLYNGGESDAGTGTLTMLDSSIVFMRMRQVVTVSSQPFTIDYTVLGSGRMYVRATTYASSALSGGLEFRAASNTSSHYDNVYYGSSASSCSWMLHEDSTAGNYDLLLVPFMPWIQADQEPSSSSAIGIKSSGWSMPSGSRQTWEFMIDFSHKSLHDSTVALKYANDYRNPDTMSFYTGTPLLEKAWEDRLLGHWKLDENAGDTAGDNSSSGNIGFIRGGHHWTNGKVGWADSLDGTDSITVAPSTNFNGSPAFTIMGWIKPGSALSTSSVIFKKYSSTNNGYKLTGASGGQLLFTLNNGGSGVSLQGKTVIGVGQWYHVAARLTCGLDTMKLYVNGVLDTTLYGSFSAYPGISTDSVVMGKGYNGVLDDMRFYNQDVWDQQVRAISLKGYSPVNGIYDLRDDNNSTVNCVLDGSMYNHYLPVFQMQNYWSASLPAQVYLDGTQLTSGVDYYASLDANIKTLTVGLNRTINRESNVYISASNAIGVTLTNTMPKMYWGKTTNGSTDYIWVQNFSGDVFGSSAANQFFFDWNMNKGGNKGGEMSFMASSKISPNAKIDTVNGTNLISGADDIQTSTMGYSCLNIGTTYPRSTRDIKNAFTYSVAESSCVRVKLLINSRDVSDSFNIATQWTIYPTGQAFRWDSIYTTKTINHTYHGFYEDNAATKTPYSNEPEKRVAVSSPTLQDFVATFLGFKNSGGFVANPWLKDTLSTASDAYRTGYDFDDLTTNPLTIWNLPPLQIAFYLDMQCPTISSGHMDSVGKGVQYITPLTMTNGTLVTNSVGDLNGDGFNEREGAYVVAADNANTSRFTLHARQAGGSYTTDTTRYYPAFRITNYYGATEPQYIMVNSVLKTKDYGYNVYLNKTNKEVVIQLNQIIYTDADIYISYDKTLAVTMTNFRGMSGDRNDTLRWRTESEEDNLGFYVYKRVKPQFLDSLYAQLSLGKRAAAGTDSADNAMQCLQKGIVSYADTGWKKVNPQIIMGAKQGVSYGPRNYSFVDYDVYNDILYEYRLEAIDYHSNIDLYKQLAQVKPGRIVPLTFALAGNFPNPFRAVTNIRFALPVKTEVSLYIFNLQGRLVRTLLSGQHFDAGYYKSMWNGRDDKDRPVAGGPYIYRFVTPKFTKANIMMFVK